MTPRKVTKTDAEAVVEEPAVDRDKLVLAIKETREAIALNADRPWGPIAKDGTRRLSLHRDRAARHDVLTARLVRLEAELGSGIFD